MPALNVQCPLSKLDQVHFYKDCDSNLLFSISPQVKAKQYGQQQAALQMQQQQQ